MISSWEEDPDIILLDYYIETRQGVAMNGDKILHFIRRISKNLPVVILTSNEDISEATTMLKKGAVDYILKDNELQHNLEKTLVQILEARQLRQEISENRLKIKKYRQRFVIICLVLALAAVTILWLST
jgi:DNA-binding NtrC family response regulator